MHRKNLKGWNEVKTNDSWSVFKIMGEFVDGFENLNVELLSNNESYLKTINDRSVIPNVTKLSLSDAIAVLENLGLEVEVYGDGNKINQSIKSGTKITKNQKIILKLT